MIYWLRQFFETNELAFYFLYGQVYFVVGMAIALQSWKYSRLAMVRSLPFLAIFGVANGLAQWGSMFIPLQAAYLSPTQISALEFAKISLWALAYASLMRFGLLLMTPYPVSERLATWLPLGLLLTWETVLVGSWLLRVDSDQTLLLYAETIGHYVLGGPSALVAAYGLHYHIRREIQPLNVPRIQHFLRVASLSLVILAVFNFVFVPYAPFFPARVINKELLTQLIGIPAEVFLAVLGIVLAYSIIRAMSIFQIETEQALADASQSQLLMADRERIGRELHDGTIQSIYAAGLVIESARFLIKDSPAEAQSKLDQVMQSLNYTIQDIRRYIFDLRTEPEGDPGDLEQQLSQLVRDLRINTLLTVDVAIKGKPPRRLTPQQRRNTLRIVQEAFANTARHAQAKRVEVRLEWQEDQLNLNIADDGIGLKTTSGHLHGHGLRNMYERANLLGGTLTIESEEGKGVAIDLEVPYRIQDDNSLRDRYSGRQHHEDNDS